MRGVPLSADLVARRRVAAGFPSHRSVGPPVLAFAVLAAVGVAQPFPTTSAVASPPVRDGDVVFHTSRSSQSVAIQRATHSPYSHMGVVFHRAGRPFVFEAVSTVRYTPLDRWIARGDRGRFVVKRLKDAPRVLSPDALERLRSAARAFEGRPYDITFEWSDDRIYCSELVWKLYDRALGLRIGHLQKLRDFDLRDSAVRATMRERYGERVPLEEPVISPAAMFESPLLATVAAR